MKKIVQLFAVLMVISLVLISCASEEEPETFEVNFDENSGNPDFNGLELVYRVNLDSGNGVDATENYLGYTYNTELCDLAMKRIQDIENQFNCTIRVKNDGTASNFQYLAASGQTDCDIYLGPSFNVSAWAKAGYLAGISTLSDYIDYKDSEKWGSPLLLECMCYEDDLYGVTPNAWPEQNYSSIGYILFANVDLIRQNGANEPRELAEQKKWFWDDFHTELRANTVVEGQETKSFGLISHYPYFSEMIFHSNGVHYAVVNPDGSYSCGYYTDAALRAAAEISNVWNGEFADTVCKENVDSSEIPMRNFVSGRGAYAFLPTHFFFGVYGEIAMNLDNFAILPTPTGPDVDPDYVSAIYHSMYYDISFPIFSNHPDAAAMVVNAIYEPLPGFETRQDIKDYMAHNYFFDERDADVFFDLFDHAHYNYFYTTGGKSRQIPETVVQSNKSMTEILDSMKEATDVLFEEEISPVLDGITSLFPDFVS